MNFRLRRFAGHEQQVRARLAETVRYIISQRLVPKAGGGRLLVTELMGSSLRSREVMALGETETRRIAEIIEAGSIAGWHSFEQSLLKAYEQDLVTQETAVLYCTNKPQIDVYKRQPQTSRRRTTAAPCNFP